MTLPRAARCLLVVLSCGGCTGGGLDDPDTDGTSSSGATETTGGAEASSEDASTATTLVATGPGESSTTQTSAVDSSSGVPGCDATGFHLDGATLLDVNCQPFVMRGVNYPFVWYADRDDTEAQLAAIAQTGANAVRIVLGNGEQWTRVDGPTLATVLQWAREAGLVSIVEVHDATGWSEQTTAADPQSAVDYWRSDDILAALEGTEDTVLLNVANEPFGNTTTEQWAPFHAEAVAALREAGLPHTLLVDAPNWGQDWTNTMRDGAAATSVFDADPDANTMFSVHMYEVYGTPSSVQSYLSTFLDSGLALVVGEFASTHNGQPVAAETILQETAARDVGALGWSWSGNSARFADLDVVVDFDPSARTPWGDLLVDGEGGLAQTGQRCSCLSAR
ncbi:MAG: glycoside hydrolase family 5 protein [Myxococcota bacterium]